MTETEKAFIQYTDSYREYGEKIIQKTDHSKRVRNLCMDISGSLDLGKEDMELSAVCGLFHDIGRFEQWKRYQTYNDSRSEDHGNLGMEILKTGTLLSSLRKTQQNTVLKVVKYHNKFRVPDTLSTGNKLFVNITRDADKIDILHMFLSGEIAKQTRDSVISDHVYQSLLDGKKLRKQDIKTKADAIAGYLAFLFDINYPRSFAIIKENDYIGRIFDQQISETPNNDLKKQLEELRKHIIIPQRNGYLNI